MILKPANWLIAIGHIGSVSMIGGAAWTLFGYAHNDVSHSLWLGTSTPMALSTATWILIGGIVAFALTTAVHRHLTICHKHHPTRK